MGSGRKQAGQWAREHGRDPFVRRAAAEGWRTRAVYKLEEIDRRDRLFRPGQVVVDLGAAPGGWSQYVASRIKPGGRVFALDLLAMDPVDDVEVIHADFTEDEALMALNDALEGQAVDLVISDMAPNLSGVKAIDQPRSMYLAELALDFACRVVKPGGGFLTKLFQGEGSDAFIATMRRHFEAVKVRKPEASKPQSREVYAVGLGHRMV